MWKRVSTVEMIFYEIRRQTHQHTFYILTVEWTQHYAVSDTYGCSSSIVCLCRKHPKNLPEKCLVIFDTMAEQLKKVYGMRLFMKQRMMKWSLSGILNFKSVKMFSLWQKYYIFIVEDVKYIAKPSKCIIYPSRDHSANIFGIYSFRQTAWIWVSALSLTNVMALGCRRSPRSEYS